MKPRGGDRSRPGVAWRLLLASLTTGAAFIVAPRPLAAAASLSVAPQRGAVGDELTATGAGFQSGTVSLHVDSVPDVQVAAGIAVDGGGFTARFRIPDVAPGPHTLIACLDNSGSRCADRATASFRVVAPPATTSTTAVATTTTTTTAATTTTTAATTTTVPVPHPPTTPTQPTAELATPLTLPPQIAAPVDPPTSDAMATTLPLTLVAGDALSSGQQVVLTELSADPQDWSDDVPAFLQSQGIDADDLDGAVAQDTPGGLLSNESGCAVQCITSGVAYAVGTGAHLRVETSVPATIYITVLDQPAGLVSSPSSTNEWAYTWAPLHANSTYTAVVYAVDANDNTDVASGTFTTLTRFASVEVSDFQGQAQSPYEHFHLRTWINTAGIDELSHETGDLPDPLVWSYDVGPVVASLVILVEGTLHDHQAPGSCLNQASNDLPTAPGESDCDSISGVVELVVALDAYPANATYWTEHTISTTLSTPGPFLLGGGEEAPFPFSVQVHVDVWYGHPSLQEPPGS